MAKTVEERVSWINEKLTIWGVAGSVGYKVRNEIEKLGKELRELERERVRYRDALEPFAEFVDRVDSWQGGPPSPLHAIVPELQVARAVFNGEPE